MNKLNRSFFSEGEIILVGYSSAKNAFSKMAYDGLVSGGLKVYPINTRTNANFDIKVYKSLNELPKIPKTAYILTNKAAVKDAVIELAGKGVKKILFQNRKYIDAEILAECTKNGIEVAVGCPMMVYGKGMHKFHALLSGVK